MTLEIKLDLTSSALLRAYVDERHFRLWTFEPDGAFVRHREHKLELEGLVNQILGDTSAEELRSLAREDTALVRGSTFRGPEPFDPETGDLRVIAIRQIERALHGTHGKLLDAAYLPAAEDDRVCQTVPGLFGRLETKHLLLPLTAAMVRDRTGWHDRAFRLDEFAVYPHPALRPARELVQDLCALAEAGANVKVAIDPHAVVPIADARGIGLFDYWYGMKLNLDSLDDMTALGATIHGRRIDQQAWGTYPLLTTEFRWSLYSDSLKYLEVTETVPRSSVVADHGRTWFTSQYVQNRYLHSIRDTASRGFVHVDGAAKAFPRDTYGPTIENPSAPQGDPIYRKLFRIDGPIPDKEWSHLVAHFFRGNELVIEYFGDVLDEREAALGAA